MINTKIGILLFCFLLISCSSSEQSQDNYEETRKLLAESRISEENLYKFFQNDKELTADLIKALSDKDKSVRDNAQTVIRFTGNRQALEAMYDWLSRNALKEKDFPNSPIPVPINDWEYEFEKKGYMYLSRSNLDNGYALLFDGSEKAMAFFDKLVEHENQSQYDSGKGKLLERLREIEIGKPFEENGDLANAVLHTSFFQLRTDNRFSKSTADVLKVNSLLYNSSKTRALLEVQNEDGTFEVTVEKTGDNLWKFYSVVMRSIF